MNNDHPDEINIDDCTEYLKNAVICPICFLPVYDNVECCFCGSIFCESCIERLDFDERCPHCREDTSFDENKLMTRILGQIKIQCNYCGDSICRENIYMHLNVCIGPLKRCNICGIRENTKLHQCNYTYCKHCDRRYRKGLETSHLDTCVQTFISCDYCGVSLKRGEYSMHLNICISYLYECPFCSELTNNLDSPDHIKKCPEALQVCDTCGGIYRIKQLHNCNSD